MAPAIRADGLTAERAVLNLLNYVVVAVTMVKWAHCLKVYLTAAWARIFCNHMVAGVALEAPGVLYLQFFDFFFSPVHFSISFRYVYVLIYHIGIW